MVVIAIYKGVDHREEITRESEITSLINKLKKYLDSLFPNYNGCNCNPGIKIDFYG